MNGHAEASTSSNPSSTLPASYHPHPRPKPIQTDLFERLDPFSIKQELHDALGENGLPYWKAMNAYLLGQMGRAEMAEVVKEFLKGRLLTLHNRFLMSLLSVASSPPSDPSSGGRKRRRGPNGYEEEVFDSDETFIEHRSRVNQWVMGLSGRERLRIRKAVLNNEDAEGEDENPPPRPNAVSRGPWSKLSSAASQPPLASGQRYLPSSIQLQQRLSQMAQASGLSLGIETDVGDFMAIGMDAHLSEVASSLVQLTGHDRPNEDTIRLNRNTRKRSFGETRDARDARDDVDGEPEPEYDDGYLPKPDLNSIQALLALSPGLHSQVSPAVYKLLNALSMPEERPVKTEPGEAVVLETQSRASSPVKMTGTATTRQEAVVNDLAAKNLLKIDKAGRQPEAVPEEGGKKAKKHTLHWVYEDPALILKDVLG